MSTDNNIENTRVTALHACQKERWTIEFEDMPDPDGVPMSYRVRRLLKLALRSCRLKCIGVDSNNPKPTAPPPGENL